MAIDIRSFYIIFVISVITLLLNLKIVIANNNNNNNEDVACLYNINETSVIDISKLKGTPLTAYDGKLLYTYTPCINTDFKEFSTCKNATLCLHDTSNPNDTGKILGNALTRIFTMQDSLNQMTFKYDDTTTIIDLLCTPEQSDTFLLTQSKDDKNKVLVLTSKEACIKYHEPPSHNSSLSNGSVFLILLFVGFIIYMVGGACMLYIFRGARGYEMIPNIDFWRGLPSLVRDGCLYLMNGCTLPTTVTTTAESYDRI